MSELFPIQQGDVKFFKIPAIPSTAKKDAKKDGKCILANGEHTGHCHAICDETTDMFIGEDGKKFLNVTEETIVTHQEHKPHVVYPGLYEIGIVNAWDYDKKMADKVKD